MIAFLTAHWGMIVSIGVPVLVVITASLVNEFQDPDHDPSTPDPTWVRVLKVFNGLLSMRGVGGGWSVPLVTRADNVKPAEPKNSERGSVAFALLVPLSIVGLALCALMALWTLSGCETARYAARATQGTIQSAYLGALDAWPKIDRERQMTIARAPGTLAEREANLEHYRTTVQQPVQTALAAILHALLVLDEALTAAEAGGQADWGKALTAVVSGVEAFRKLLADFQINIKLPKLVARTAPEARRYMLALGGARCQGYLAMAGGAR